MTIKYSPDFTGEYYLKLEPGKCILEQTILGDTGLLEAFELRLGLPSREEREMIRAIEYRRALEKHKEGSFYEESFKVDPFGVAVHLLSWRDTLLMQGWAPKTISGQERLDKLSEVEKTFEKQSDCPGAPERWKAVIEEMAQGRKPFSEDVADIFYPKDLLPELINNAISLSGAVVNYKRELAPKQVTFKNQQVEIRRYVELTDAFEAIALETQPEGTVIINGDNFRLNAVLRRHNMALEQASTDKGNPSIPQLFKLGLSLLARPFDPQMLLSFLQLPTSPLPGKLSSALSRALLEDNGIGEKWEEALKAHPESHEKAETYLLRLIEDRSDHNIPTDTAVSWCKAVVKWVEERLHDEKHPASAIDVPQFASLETSCRGILRALDYESATMDPTAFGNLVKSLYNRTSIRIDESEVHSFDTVASPAAIISNPSRLVWLDCNGVLDVIWPYSFLTIKEIEVLKGMGMKIPANEQYFRYGFSLVTNLLDTVNDIVLVRSDYDCGEPLREHPAVTLALKAGIKEKHCPSPEWDGPQVSIPSRESFDMGVDVLGGFLRKESVSSIELLIDHPADYYLKYVLNLKDVKDQALADVVRARGLVAHLTFENLMKDGNKDVSAMLALVKAPGFHKRVYDATASIGANLLLGENEIDFEGLVVTLKDSFTVLLEILKDSRLKPYGTEFPLADGSGNGVNIGGEIGEVTGFVDLIAQTSGGDFVIIDFKYPKSRGKYYIDKLTKDESIQLEVYSRAVAAKLGKPVLATAYYLIPLMELHTCDTSKIFSGKGVFKEVKELVTPDLTTRINEGIKQSRDEFRAGSATFNKSNGFTFGRQADTYEILKDKIQ